MSKEMHELIYYFKRYIKRLIRLHILDIPAGIVMCIEIKENWEHDGYIFDNKDKQNGVQL